MNLARLEIKICPISWFAGACDTCRVRRMIYIRGKAFTASDELEIMDNDDHRKGNYCGKQASCASLSHFLWAWRDHVIKRPEWDKSQREAQKNMLYKNVNAAQREAVQTSLCQSFKLWVTKHLPQISGGFTTLSYSFKMGLTVTMVPESCVCVCVCLCACVFWWMCCTQLFPRLENNRPVCLSQQQRFLKSAALSHEKCWYTLAVQRANVPRWGC